jgi:tRNA-specific 2-thiouridylase
MNNKAIVLYSGGLDSLLALHIALRLDLEVSALFIKTLFYKKDIKSLQDSLEKLNIKLYVAEIDNVYLNILKNPTYGFGKNLNPCLDCRIMMFSEAKKTYGKLRCFFYHNRRSIEPTPI